MAALDKLAAEVLLMIGAYVQDEADLASLVRVCRRLYCTLDHELYKRDVQTGLPLSVLWGSRFGLQGTLEKAHMAGANLEQAWMSRIRSIFPDLSLTGNFTIDEIPTAASVTATTKKYHNSLFKHIPPFFKRFSPQTGKPNTASFHQPRRQERARGQDGGQLFYGVFSQQLPHLPGTLRGSPASVDASIWWHPLDLAILFGHHDVVRYLLEKGVKVANSHSRGLCCRSDVCHGSEKIQIVMNGLKHPSYSHLNRVHNSLTLAACLGDVAIQKMLLIQLGLEDMARDLCRDEVEAHGYRADRFLEGSKEKEVLSTFMTLKAEAVQKQMSEEQH